MLLDEQRSDQPAALTDRQSGLVKLDRDRLFKGLSLTALKHGPTGKYVAQMVIECETSMVNKSLGVRQLMFVYLLVKSGRLLRVGDEEWTVVDQNRLSRPSTSG